MTGSNDALQRLAELSVKAAPGEWRAGFAHWGQHQIDAGGRNVGQLNNYVGLGGREVVLNAEQEASAEFVAILVNAYRAGLLVPPPPTTESEKVADLKRQLAGERDHGKRLQQQLDAILRTDSAVNDIQRAQSSDERGTRAEGIACHAAWLDYAAKDFGRNGKLGLAERLKEIADFLRSESVKPDTAKVPEGKP